VNHIYCTEHDQPLEWCMQGVEGVTPHCRHGIPVTDPDAAACAFYENPENLRVAGPGQRRKARDE